MSRPLSIKAHAKINLTLEVLARRDDGYHEIITVIQTIGLHDRLHFEPSDSLTLECAMPDLETSDNLVMKAAKLLKERAGTKQGARIRLEKSIPVGAGLGGGSSDAAAALKGLCQLWSIDLALGDLMALAAHLGSDVPFFLQGGTALAQGRGERVRPLPPANIEWLVLLRPPLEVPQKTATLYSMLSPSSFTKGLLCHKLAGRIRGGGDVPPQFLFNVFDEVACKAFPGLETYWTTFQSLGATEVHLAGSGPCLFALVPRREVGAALQLLLQHRYGWEAYLTSKWDGSPGERS